MELRYDKGIAVIKDAGRRYILGQSNRTARSRERTFRRANNRIMSEVSILEDDTDPQRRHLPFVPIGFLSVRCHGEGAWEGKSYERRVKMKGGEKAYVGAA